VRLPCVSRDPAAPRTLHPTDKRAKLIHLTAKGLEAQRIGFSLFAKLEADWGDAFGVDRIAALRTLLEEIALAKASDAGSGVAVPVG